MLAKISLKGGTCIILQAETDYGSKYSLKSPVTPTLYRE